MGCRNWFRNFSITWYVNCSLFWYSDTRHLKLYLTTSWHSKSYFFDTHDRKEDLNQWIFGLPLLDTYLNFYPISSVLFWLLELAIVFKTIIILINAFVFAVKFKHSLIDEWNTISHIVKMSLNSCRHSYVIQLHETIK